MQKLLSWSAAVVVGWVGISSVANAAPQNPKTEAMAKIDDLAQKVFKASDRNHNNVLNKSEFANAQEALEQEVNQWGQMGLIGRPQKANAKNGGKKRDHGEAELAKASAAVAGVDASEGKLAKSNHVSLAEFTFYAHSVVEKADDDWRTQNTAMQAQAQQAKIMAAQKRAMMNNNRMRRRPYPY